MRNKHSRLKFLFSFVLSFLILSIPTRDEKRLFDKFHEYLPDLVQGTKDFADRTISKIHIEKPTKLPTSKKFITISKEEYKQLQSLKEKILKHTKLKTDTSPKNIIQLK